MGLPRWQGGKESASNAGDAKDASLIPGSERSLEKGMATHSQGHRKSDTTEHIYTHTYQYNKLETLKAGCRLSFENTKLPTLSL